MSGIDGGTCPVCGSRGRVCMNSYAGNYTCFCAICGYGAKFKIVTNSNGDPDLLLCDKRRSRRKFARIVIVKASHRLGFSGKAIFYPDKGLCPAYPGGFEVLPVTDGKKLKWRLFKKEGTGNARKKIIGEYSKFIEAERIVEKLGF